MPSYDFLASRKLPFQITTCPEINGQINGAPMFSPAQESFKDHWYARSLFFCASRYVAIVMCFLSVMPVAIAPAGAADEDAALLLQIDRSLWTQPFLDSGKKEASRQYFSGAHRADSVGDVQVMEAGILAEKSIPAGGGVVGCPAGGEVVTVPVLLGLMLASEHVGGKVDRTLEIEFINRSAVFAEYFIPKLSSSTSYTGQSSASSGGPSSRGSSANRGVDATVRLPTETTITFGMSVNNTRPETSKAVGTSVSITQAFGRSGLASKHQRISADMGLKRAIINWKDARESLFVDAFTKLFKIISARNDLELQSKLLNAAEKTANLQRVRKAAGFLSRNALLLAEAAVHSARVQLRQSEASLDAVYRDLVASLGCQGISDWKVKPFDFPVMDTAPLKAKIDELTLRSVLAEKLRMEQIDLDWQKRLHVREGYPDINLTFSSSKNTTWYEAQSKSWSLGDQHMLTLSMPIFDLPLRYRRKATDVQLRTQQEDINLKLTNLKFDLRELFRQSELNDEILVAAKEQIEFARVRYEQDLEKYRIGQTTAQNLELAQQNLTSAQRTYSSQQLSAFTSKLAIFRALGQFREVLVKLDMEQVYWLKGAAGQIDPDYLIDESWLL